MPIKKIYIGSIVTRNNKDFISSMVGDEVVMMGMDSGNYIGMNSVGSSIWQLLEKPIKVSEITDSLLDIYEVAKEQCEQQVLEFLEKLNGQDMLIIIE